MSNQQAFNQPLRNNRGSLYLKRDGKAITIVVGPTTGEFNEQATNNRAFTIPLSTLNDLIKRGFGKLDIAELPPRK